MVMDFYQFIERYSTSFFEWLERNQQDILRIGLIVVAAWLFSKYMETIMYQFLERTVHKDHFQTPADREKRIRTLSGMGSALIKFVIWAGVAISIINIVGINVGPIMASAGIVGIALGLGSQKLINDLVSGVFIIAENQYRIGDFVEIEGVSGVVESISIRTTVLRDLNGSLHHVPNGQISVTTNKSMGYGKVNMDIMVKPDTDLDKLSKIINTVGDKIAKSPEFSGEIIEKPHLERVTNFSGDGVTVNIIGKTTGGKQLEIKSALLTELKYAFDKHKIELARSPLVSNQSKK